MYKDIVIFREGNELQIPLPSVALRRQLPPPMGEEAFGGRWPSWKTSKNASTANKHKASCSGGKRAGAQPSRSPHRDGSGRRQIPRPFGRRDEGHTCYSQQTKKQPTYGGRPWIVPARRTKGQSKGFDQRERVAVFWFLFFKRGTAGCGGAQPPPCPSQRHCGMNLSIHKHHPPVTNFHTHNTLTAEVLYLILYQRR